MKFSASWLFLPFYRHRFFHLCFVIISSIIMSITISVSCLTIMTSSSYHSLEYLNYFAVQIIPVKIFMVSLLPQKIYWCVYFAGRQLAKWYAFVCCINFTVTVMLFTSILRLSSYSVVKWLEKSCKVFSNSAKMCWPSE